MKNYTEPQITDYGSISEMTAGLHFHRYSDATNHASDLQTESTGVCYAGGAPGANDSCPKP